MDRQRYKLAMRVLICSALLMSFVGPVSASTITAFANACFFQSCIHDTRSGNPAVASASRGENHVDPTPGNLSYSVSSSTATAASWASFSFYAEASGHASNGGFTPVTINAGGGVQYAETNLIFHGGTGLGTAVFPWLISGTINVQGGIPSSGIEGFPGSGGVNIVAGCQLSPVGAMTGGVTCAPRRPDEFRTSATYSELWNLTVQFTFGVEYNLITNIGGGAGIAVTNASASAIGDFSHTGLLQPVRIFDSLGNPVVGATITSGSGLDYFNPQATAGVPEPGSYWLVFCGLSAVFARVRSTASRRRFLRGEKHAPNDFWARRHASAAPSDGAVSRATQARLDRPL